MRRGEAMRRRMRDRRRGMSDGMLSRKMRKGGKE